MRRRSKSSAKIPFTENGTVEQRRDSVGTVAETH